MRLCHIHLANWVLTKRVRARCWRTATQQPSTTEFGARSASAPPGSRAALPPPRPLRTVRESLPSHGSSLSNAPHGGTRCDEETSSHLHGTHLQPTYSPLGLREAAPASSFLAVICSASCVGSPNSPVMRDPTEVCPLSRGVMLPLLGRNPYPSHYRAAFAFSVLLYPLRRPPSLRLGYHMTWDTTGLPS